MPALAILAAFLGIAMSAADVDPVSPTAVYRLQDCVRMAVERNPDLAAAHEQVRAAQAAIDIADASFFPTVAIEETYTATNNPTAAFMMDLNQRKFGFGSDFNDPETTDNFNTRLGISWRLYDGGRRGEGRQAALAGKGSSSAQAEAVRNEMVYLVHRGFYGVLQARELVRIQEASIRSLERSLETARRRLQAGTVVKTDVLNLELKLAETREALARARNREALARSALASLVGEPGLRNAEIAGPTEAVVEATEDLLSLSADGRPELRSAEMEVMRLESEVAGAKRAWRPSVDFIASYDLDGEQPDDPEDSWVAGLSARWEAFDGFRRQAEIGKAEAELARARQKARRVRLDVEHELREVILAYQEAQERVEVTAKSVELAQESLRVTRNRYENGAAEITELLAAETALTLAQALETSALYDREVGRAGLRRATGKFADALAGH